MRILNINEIYRGDAEQSVVFITGVSGQDGSHMVDYLLQNTDALIFGGARRLSVENHDNIKHLENEDRFSVVNFDLTDSHSIYKLVEILRPNYFINFAAQSFVASSWDFARQTWETNSTAVLDCLEAIHRFVPYCRFYNAGSSEEFGNVSYTPQDENHPAKPRSPYGASKCAARTLVKVYRESYGLYAVQGWLYNHEGERRGKEFVTRKITQGVAKIKKTLKGGGTPTPIEIGNINAKRDWSYAPDFMDAVWRMLNQDKYNESILPAYTFSKYMTNASGYFKEELVPKIKDYVVSSGETHTIREFVEEAFRVADIDGTWVGHGVGENYMTTINDKIYCLVSINPIYYRPAEVDVLQGNSSKIRDGLGWKPKTSFKELVKLMVDHDIKLLE